MNNIDLTPDNSLSIDSDKDNHFETQMKRVFEAFKRKPSTMLMVSFETGILRANLCRYIAKWQKSNSIHKLKQGLCKVSKHRAGFYTANPELFPTSKQLNLF